MRLGSNKLYWLGLLSIGIAGLITVLLPILGSTRHHAREDARAVALAAGLRAVEAAKYDEAVPLLLPSAERGDKRAIIKLAEAIAFDGKQDADEEALWFPKAAALDPGALFQIATKLEASPWGLENTIDLYDAASRHGSKEAHSRLAQLHQDAELAFKGDDKEVGIAFSALLARTGEFWPQSHDLLVQHLYTLEGERGGDLFEAVGSVYERARAGDAYAALDLGRTFSVSPLLQGAARDHQVAVGWLQIAAQNDDLQPDNAAAAMYWLGVEHLRCADDCRNDERALLWFALAEVTCNKIGTDDLVPPCDGARGASSMLKAKLDATSLQRVDQLTGEWAKGNKAAVVTPIRADVLFSEPLSPVSREKMDGEGSLVDQFAWLGAFDGLDEAQLQLWIARHIDKSPRITGREVMECGGGNPQKYFAVVGPASDAELKLLCRTSKAPSCRRVSRALLVEMCSPPSS